MLASHEPSGFNPWRMTDSSPRRRKSLLTTSRRQLRSAGQASGLSFRDPVPVDLGYPWYWINFAMPPSYYAVRCEGFARAECQGIAGRDDRRYMAISLHVFVLPDDSCCEGIG